MILLNRSAQIREILGVSGKTGEEIRGIIEYYAMPSRSIRRTTIVENEIYICSRK